MTRGSPSYGTRPDWLTPVMTPELHEQFPTPESPDGGAADL